VLAYLNSNSRIEEYDESIYPPLESVPKRFAILRRNEWAIMESDIIVSYVIRSWGGAAKALEYAKRKGKRIIPYADSKCE